LVVSAAGAAILVESILVVSAGAILLESAAGATAVESFEASELEEPLLQAAKIAHTERAIRTFFILINLDF
jgi:hypothetical protein